MAEKEKKPKVRSRGQNEGQIRKRKDGTYEARYSLGFDNNGKRIRRSLYAKTRSEIAVKLNNVLNELNKGTYIEASKLKISDWMDIWLETYKKPNIKPITYDSYKMINGAYIVPRIGHYLLKDLRTEHIQRFINESSKKVGNGALNNIYTLIKGSLAQAVINDIIVKNVAAGVRLPKSEEDTKVKCLTIEEQERFIEATKNYRNGLMFRLMLVTGLRRAETIALKWQDIDFKTATLSVCRTMNRIVVGESSTEVEGTPKSRKAYRDIPLILEIFQELQKHKKEQELEKRISHGLYKDNGFIFANEIGKHIDARTVQYYYNKIRDDAKIKAVTMHGLRHTFATRGLERGIDLKIMQELLGHSNLSMTADIYSHVLPNLKKEAMEKLRGIMG